MNPDSTPPALPRRGTVPRLAALLAVVLLWQVLAGLAPQGLSQPAEAQTTKPTAAVLLGDSFSSGEGARWKGNSLTASADRAGTDDAARQNSDGSWRYEPTRAYDSKSYSNGCHRSRHAGISSMYNTIVQWHLAGLDEAINLACSGAETKHLWPYAAGGTAFKTEQPQIAQLYNVAGTHDVKLIMVGIGGNDIGFGSMVEKCVKAWHHSQGYPTLDPQIGTHCSDDIREDHEPKLPQMRANVMKTIDEVRKMMTQRGYSKSDYRLVLVGYPGVLARPERLAHPEASRKGTQCPIRTSDAGHIADSLVPKLNSSLQAAAHLKDVEFLDLSYAFNGHRLCEVGTTRTKTTGSVPSPATSEWVRFLDLTPGFPPDQGWQGHWQEAVHPNQFGHRAVGRCMRGVWQGDGGHVGCRGFEGKDNTEMLVFDGRAPFLESNLVQTIKANLGQISVNRGFGVTGNPYSPTDRVVVDVEVDAPFHHLLEITVERPDGKIETLLPKAGSTGGGVRTHRALLTAPANPDGVWRVRIANYGQFTTQNATVRKITLTHY